MLRKVKRRSEKWKKKSFRGGGPVGLRVTPGGLMEIWFAGWRRWCRLMLNRSENGDRKAQNLFARTVDYAVESRVIMLCVSNRARGSLQGPKMSLRCQVCAVDGRENGRMQVPGELPQPGGSRRLEASLRLRRPGLQGQLRAQEIRLPLEHGDRRQVPGKVRWVLIFFFP